MIRRRANGLLLADTAVGAEQAGRGEFTELVADHVLGDVHRDEGLAVVHGEGEALILVAASPDPDRIAKLPGRMKALGFDGNGHPDVQLVWTGLLERQRKAPAAANFRAYLKSLTHP